MARQIEKWRESWQYTLADAENAKHVGIDPQSMRPVPWPTVLAVDEALRQAEKDAEPTRIIETAQECGYGFACYRDATGHYIARFAMNGGYFPIEATGATFGDAVRRAAAADKYGWLREKKR